LTACEKGLYEFAFAANAHCGKSFEPFAVRDFRFGIEPVCQRPKLVRRNLPRLDSIEQMI
jgi:hypothetical protein